MSEPSAAAPPAAAPPSIRARAITLASWLVPPVGMALAYSVLAWSSNTDTSGKAWMALGFGFVMVVWLVLRILVEQTALARAVAAADADRILAIADKQLARRRGDTARAPFLVYAAFAHESRGEHARALARLADARPAAPGLQLLATAIRVLALAETGQVADARHIANTELEPRAAKLDVRLHPAPHTHADLARGRLLAAEGAHDAARAQLQKIIDDIRAGHAIRERARELQARIAS